jgi:DNA adenine methylase
MKKNARQQAVPHPFLKWAGGKRQLLEELRSGYCASGHTGRYHEPFLGGGALFFDLHRRESLGRKQPFLSDTNGRLIECYHAIRDDVDTLITLLEAHKERHGKDYYYSVRAAVPSSLTERAARIIYMNRTCFNGLFRENSKGEFNVPIGDYKNPKICDAENLRAVSKALVRTKVEQASFTAVLKHAKPGDFVYFDPPYHPISKSASFTAYHAEDFGEKEQTQLAEVFRALDQKEVHVMLSNSMTPLIKKLYADFTIGKVFATRNVNRDATKRGKIAEALVRNF